MNSPDQDEQLPKPVSRVLAADTQAPSAETDQRILQFAADHAPTPQSLSWKTWMPATAACCLVGVLTLSLLPEQQAETVHGVEVDLQVTKSREVVTQSKQELKNVALADEFLLTETEASSTEPTINYAAAAAPAAPAITDDGVQLTPEFFERLLVLRKQEKSTRGLSAGLAQSSARSETTQTAKKLELLRTEADSAPLMRARISRNNDDNAAYEALRNECNCGLPESLQQALDMLASKKIRPDNSKPQAMDNER